MWWTCLVQSLNACGIPLNWPASGGSRCSRVSLVFAYMHFKNEVSSARMTEMSNCFQLNASVKYFWSKHLQFWSTNIEMQVVPVNSARFLGEFFCGILVLIFPVANRTRLLLLACFCMLLWSRRVCLHPHCSLLLAFPNKCCLSACLCNTAKSKECLKVENNNKNVKVSW